MSTVDLVRGLPRLGGFLRPAAGADLGGHGVALGDDRFGLGWGDRGGVGVADDVGHAAAEHRPGAVGEVGGGDADRAEVVLAAFDHLGVVDPGELGVLFAGVVGGPDQGAA